MSQREARPRIPNSFSLGYSPCPNDTFIFYALIHGKIDTEGLGFVEILDDVETLNSMARREELDITKVSYHAFGHFRGNYCLLRSGGALGRKCGPLLVARNPLDIKDLRGKKIAIPGHYTTAFLLLQIFDPAFSENVVDMPFHRIMEAVMAGEADAGLIIHESRFTYARQGLHMIIDLGEWWEGETGMPIPLGAIICRRRIGRKTIGVVDRLIRKSVEYAFDHRGEPKAYIKAHSQELDEDVIDQHINLYVNRFSIDIGDEGERAVDELFRRSQERGIIAPSDMPLFAVE